MRRAVLTLIGLCAVSLQLIGVDAAPLRLDFGSEEIRIKAAPDQDTIISEVPFKNVSDAVVKITNYDASCSCTEVKTKEDKRTYQPGESGTLSVTFDMRNFSGETTKGVQVFLDGDVAGRPSVNLKFHITIPTLIELEPKSLRWDQGEEAAPKKITITMNHTVPVSITEVECGKELFGTELKTIEEGKKYELIITPSNTEEPDIGIILIRTDSEIGRYRVQRAFATIRPVR